MVAPNPVHFVPPQRLPGSSSNSSRTWFTPAVNQAQLPGYAIGYINFASFLIRTSVINADQLIFAVPGVDHPDD